MRADLAGGFPDRGGLARQIDAMERPVGLGGELVADVEAAVATDAQRREQVLRLVDRRPGAVGGVRRHAEHRDAGDDQS